MIKKDKYLKMDSLIRPRLNDFHGLPFTQDEVDFAIPFLDEDVPLYVDPFLLWKSPSLQDNSLHTALTNSFNHLGHIYLKGKEKEDSDYLIISSECQEVGLGTSKNKAGKQIGAKLSNEILSLYKNIPQVTKSGFTHFEEIQLFVDNISKDRISDITCNFIKSFLIDYTIEQCEKNSIPIDKVIINNVYDYKTNRFKDENVFLPINPVNKNPILLVPKRWLRYLPWISYDDYFGGYISKLVSQPNKFPDRVALLNYNRENYDVVQTYIKLKEKQSIDCKNDPLFKALPVLSINRKLNEIIALPSGNQNGNDKTYEDIICQMLATLFYPQLDFAKPQSRTDSGVLIRDLIFYNNRSYDFLKDIYDLFNCRQIVVELKNVKEVEREHINQLNRYLNQNFGSFGIIFTRNKPPKSIYKNTIDLWSGQRKCILILTDEDLKLMCTMFQGKQRIPIDVLKMKYIEFTRDLPS
ncbi:MAG: GxxExxY protein [Bacteroidales bacterium]|nr:GxxExxY protein [Bacteroidales bacterium]